MKRVRPLILIFVLCLSLCACSEGYVQNTISTPPVSNSSNTFPSSSNNATNIEQPLVIYGTNGQGYLNAYRIRDIIEVVELTTENWKDYFKVDTHTYERVQYDAFGEIISSSIKTDYILCASYERYHQYANVIIELKNISTGALTVYELGVEPCISESFLYVYEDFNINDYECIRIQGSVHFIDLPEEVISKNNQSFMLSGPEYKIFPVFYIKGGKTVCCTELLLRQAL